MVSTEDPKFPVFFPVSTRFGPGEGRMELRPPPARIGYVAESFGVIANTHIKSAAFPVLKRQLLISPAKQR